MRSCMPMSNELDIQVAADRMSATLTIPAGFPVEELHEELCTAQLEAIRVLISAETLDRVRKAIAAHREDQDIPHTVTIEGNRPVHGTDGRIELSADLVQPESQGGEDGVVDHYARTPFTLVDANMTIGRVVEPQPGEDGADVFGTVVPAKPGREAKYKIDDSIMLDASGNFVAQIGGALCVNGASIKVNHVLEITHNVDFETGNINFDGDVRVARDVRGNFEINAGGSIVINGLVEAASVRAGDNITLVTGMAGKETGALSCIRDCRSKYLEQTHCTVGRDLYVDREIIHCASTVGRSVVSPHSALIGGYLHCLGEMTVGELGSDAHTRTLVFLGSSPRYEQLIRVTQEKVDELSAEAGELQKKIDMINRGGSHINADHKEELTFLQCDQMDLVERAKRFKKMNLKLRCQRDFYRKVKLTVEKMIFENTIIVAGDSAVRFFRDVPGPIVIAKHPSHGLCYRSGTTSPLQPIAMIAESLDVEKVRTPDAA